MTTVAGGEPSAVMSCSRRCATTAVRMHEYRGSGCLSPVTGSHIAQAQVAWEAGQTPQDITACDRTCLRRQGQPGRVSPQGVDGGYPRYPKSMGQASDAANVAMSISERSVQHQRTVACSEHCNNSGKVDEGWTTPVYSAPSTHNRWSNHRQVRQDLVLRSHIFCIGRSGSTVEQRIPNPQMEVRFLRPVFSCTSLSASAGHW